MAKFIQPDFTSKPKESVVRFESLNIVYQNIEPMNKHVIEQGGEWLTADLGNIWYHNGFNFENLVHYGLTMVVGQYIKIETFKPHIVIASITFRFKKHSHIAETFNSTF